MKGKTYPLRSDPWQTLFLMKTRLVPGSVLVNSIQATGYLPVMVGLMMAPIMRLLSTSTLAISRSFIWNLRA